MATRFFFDPAEVALPSLSELKGRWRFIPDPAVRGMIAAEHQYLHFQEFLLHHLKFKTSRGFVGPFGLSARAGAVKAAVLLYGSITEAALLSHALARGYLTAGKRLMFGQVLQAWEKAGQGELAAIWNDIKLIKDRRNTIHLKAAADEDAHFKAVLQSEHALLSAGRRVLASLELLVSDHAGTPGTVAMAQPLAAPSVATARAVERPGRQPTARHASTPQPRRVPETPAELVAWLNANVHRAPRPEYRDFLERWIEAEPHLDTAGWSRLHPQVEVDRRMLENEWRERQAEEEYREYLQMAEEMDRLPRWDEDREPSWEDEAAILAFQSDGYAPEEEDEDNPNWYNLDEPDDGGYDEGGYDDYDDGY